jgi:hypothetical protein
MPAKLFLKLTEFEASGFFLKLRELFLKPIEVFMKLAELFLLLDLLLKVAELFRSWQNYS